MASALNGLIPALRSGEKLSEAAIDELDRLFLILRNEGWSGYITADTALSYLLDEPLAYDDLPLVA